MIERSTNAVAQRHSYITASGRRFELTEHPIDATPEAEDGLFLFCTEGIFWFNPLYVGQIEELRSRRAAHDRRGAAKAQGATKLLVAADPDLPACGLQDAEMELIGELRPKLNVQQMRTGPTTRTN
ncbi:hypothetical protein [Roseobacter sp.]|uniref:hypothetical protein n=1 Tax=Roseobacter sp. TaxID=1907202 RepID=UPI0032998903